MKKRCMEKVENIYGNHCDCDRPAKYKAPLPVLGREMFLCGIHRRSYDTLYANAGMDIRCIEIKEQISEAADGSTL